MIPAFALTALLALTAVFQLALALGAPLGHFAWGGAHRSLPPRFRFGSAVAIGIYGFIALLALDRAGVVDVFAETFSVVGMWIVCGYLVLGTMMNAISRSPHERYTMTPLTLGLAVLSALVASGVGARV